MSATQGSRGLLVTGTDTGVGKTRVTAGLVGALRRRGITVRVLKPVESGVEDAPEDAALLARCAGLPSWRDANLLALRDPLAPVVAAAREGLTLSMEPLDAVLCGPSAAPLLVEGVGGALVEVAPGVMVADLPARWRLDALLVAGNRLGVLSHTLLTVEALRSRGARVAVVLNALSPVPGLAERSNEAELARLLGERGVPLLGSIPFVADPAPSPLADAVDPLLDALLAWAPGLASAAALPSLG